jgi:hypothetical protein
MAGKEQKTLETVDLWPAKYRLISEHAAQVFVIRVFT